MPSVLTNQDGRVIGSTPQQRNAPWTFVPDEEYIDTSAAPEGYEQERYLLSESSLSFDVTTDSMGSTHIPIAIIDAPESIPNDGSVNQITVETTAPSDQSATLTVDDYTEGITVPADSDYTDEITTTASAGTIIDVSVKGESDIRGDAAQIEVTEA